MGDHIQLKLHCWWDKLEISWGPCGNCYLHFFQANTFYNIFCDGTKTVQLKQYVIFLYCIIVVRSRETKMLTMMQPYKISLEAQQQELCGLFHWHMKVNRVWELRYVVLVSSYINLLIILYGFRKRNKWTIHISLHGIVDELNSNMNIYQCYPYYR